MSINDSITKNICRICLSENLRFFTIRNTSLEAVYENLTNIKFCSVENVQKICYICLARLKQCQILKKQAIFTDKLLKDAAKSKTKPYVTQSFKKLTQSSTINISLDPVEQNIKEYSYTQVKTEKSEGILEDIHHIALPLPVNIEPEYIKDSFSHLDSDIKADLDFEIKNDLDNDVKFDLDDEIKSNVDEKQISDSEDDLPLVNIRLKKKLNKKEKAGKIRKYSRQTSVDAKEIILDEEQQKMEMLERAKSENYINSPFKCDLCYRGFIDPVAFDRHKEKHDKRSGAHACGVCGLRYACARRLAAHAAAAHARRYACNRCAHVARTKHQAKAHERWHNGHTYPCKPCGRVFTAPTSLLSHARRCAAGAGGAGGAGEGAGEGEGAGGERACPRCGDSFARAHGLRMHLGKAHRLDAQKHESPTEPEAERTCIPCSIVFASSAARQRHLLTSKRHHLYNAESECVICSVKVTPALRAAHTRTHARSLRPPPPPVPPVHAQCGQCKATFTSRPKLQSHVRRMHLGLKYNKNIVCEMCGKKCTSAAALRCHQRQHTGEKPYLCPVCPLAFARAPRLRSHLAAHAGARPHACALCPRAFVQRAALTRHMRVHTGVKPYSCNICNKRFTQSNSLHTHVRALHLRLPRDHSTRDHGLQDRNPSDQTRDHSSSDQNLSDQTPK